MTADSDALEQERGQEEAGESLEPIGAKLAVDALSELLLLDTRTLASFRESGEKLGESERSADVRMAAYRVERVAPLFITAEGALGDEVQRLGDEVSRLYEHLRQVAGAVAELAGDEAAPMLRLVRSEDAGGGSAPVS